MRSITRNGRWPGNEARRKCVIHSEAASSASMLGKPMHMPTGYWSTVNRGRISQCMWQCQHTHIYTYTQQANQLKGNPAYKSPSLQANQPTAMFVNLITQSNSMHEGIPTGNLNARNGGPTCTIWQDCRGREWLTQCQPRPSHSQAQTWLCWILYSRAKFVVYDV